MLVVLSYKKAAKFEEKRKKLRKDHLKLVEKFMHAKKMLIYSTVDNQDKDLLLIFDQNEFDSALDFLKKDPYVKKGLIEEWNLKVLNVDFHISSKGI